MKKKSSSKPAKLKHFAELHHGGGVEPPALSLQSVSSNEQLARLHQNPEVLAKVRAILAQQTGFTGTYAAIHLIDQASRAFALDHAEEPEMTAVEMMTEMKPEGAMQGLLAAQMIGVHNAALSALARAASQFVSGDDREASTRISIRLLRTFMKQTEAMAKLKGTAGQQKIVVEHVEVHAGAQAVVGGVNTIPKDYQEGGDEKIRTKTP
jgi:hypothetical protein